MLRTEGLGRKMDAGGFEVRVLCVVGVNAMSKTIPQLPFHN